MIIQPIVDIPVICHAHSIRQAVISPGSRSAAITLAFARFTGISSYVIPDERSAGFIALGLAQSSGNPVALICTSGTAAANLYPAIIEAFYQQVPLLVLTADRPPELTDQSDGQTIRQQHLYQNHILGFYQFPVAFDHADAHWHANRLVNEAILRATGDPKGPVHINVPIREPFYPLENEQFHYEENTRIIRRTAFDTMVQPSQFSELAVELQKYKKVLVVAGQGQMSSGMADALGKLHKNLHWVVTGDVTSNIHRVQGAIKHHDILLMKKENQGALAPDLLITFGMSVLSKNLKEFLRKTQPAAHWHLGETPQVTDTFRSLTRKVLLEPEVFFQEFVNRDVAVYASQLDFSNRWQEAERVATDLHSGFKAKNQDGEFMAALKVLDAMPDDCDLHLANSMPVRYANFQGMKAGSSAYVWANRGTSGIDGCTGTAVGHALNNHRIQLLITGDVAFFYDRNSLWHNHIPANLRIVLLNNHGGGIFRLIDGPAGQPELETYFEARHHLTAKNTAADFNIRYFSSDGPVRLSGVLDDFFNPESGPAILEIFSEPETNVRVFSLFKDYCK